MISRQVTTASLEIHDAIRRLDQVLCDVMPRLIEEWLRSPQVAAALRSLLMSNTSMGQAAAAVFTVLPEGHAARGQAASRPPEVNGAATAGETGGTGPAAPPGSTGRTNRLIVSKEVGDLIAEEYRAGLTTIEIRRRHGVSNGALYHQLKRRGVALRVPGGSAAGQARGTLSAVSAPPVPEQPPDFVAVPLRPTPVPAPVPAPDAVAGRGALIREMVARRAIRRRDAERLAEALGVDPFDGDMRWINRELERRNLTSVVLDCT